MSCKIVEFYGKDGYIYKGLLFRCSDSQKTIIHVHGCCGNLFSFVALSDLAECYQKRGLNLLTFNLKGHDCIAEGNWKTGKFEYVGGAKVRFEDCYEDIDSAIDFCKQFSHTIFLQGHSMGCERIISYQLVKKVFYNTILISPCDGYALQKKYIYPRTIEEQIFDLENMEVKDNQILNSEFGVKMQNENYSIPICKDALLSILKGKAMEVLRIDGGEYTLNGKCICFIGSKDALQIYKPEEMFQMLRGHFKEVIGNVFPTDHEFTGLGNEIGEIIANWTR